MAFGLTDINQINGMSWNDRFIVRRTLSQERFEVLWTKRLEGEATLKELIEMDEIINRDPLVRQFVLKEMENESLPHHGNDRQNMLPHTSVPRQTFIDKVRSFFYRFDIFQPVADITTTQLIS